MLRWVWITLGLLALWASLALAQDFSTGGDPWWRPLSPFGQSYGITVGNTRPTLPRSGELFLDVDDDQLELYNGAAWIRIGLDVGLSIVFEGATEDAFETTLAVVEPTADQTYQMPNQATGTYALVFSTLATNALDVVNSAWLVSNGLRFEGATADDFEATLDVVDPTVADRTIRFPNANFVLGGAGWTANTAAATVNPTVPITAAGQTSRGLYINLTNVNHTGGNLNALEIALDALDADAVETAIRLTGWDRGVWVNDAVQLVLGTDADVAISWSDGLSRLDLNAGGTSVLVTASSGFEWTNTLASHRLFTSALPAAGASGNLASIVSTINAMDAAGGDVVNAFIISLTNANHTGGTLNGLNIANLVGDVDATENAINIGTGWDRAIALSSGTVIALVGNLGFETSSGNITLSPNGGRRFSTVGGQESVFATGTDLPVVGAAQNVDPISNIVEISAGAGASVTTITAPSFDAAWITFICVDANVTFNDSDAAGAANTINLAGAATNFVCSADDTLTLVFDSNPTAGNARWVEADRSVN